MLAQILGYQRGKVLDSVANRISISLPLLIQQFFFLAGSKQLFAEKLIQNISLLVSQFIANLIGNTDKINSIFINLEDTTQRLRETINDSQQEFHMLGQNMTEISNALADDGAGVRPFLKNLNQLMQGVKGEEVQGLTVKLDHILNSVGRVLNKLEKENSSLSRLIEHDDFYNNLNQTVGALNM